MMDVEPAAVGTTRHLAAALIAQQHGAAQRRGESLVSTGAYACTRPRREPSRGGAARRVSLRRVAAGELEPFAFGLAQRDARELAHGGPVELARCQGVR
jgi:hypothetical protein